MTVKELKEKLDSLPENANIVLEILDFDAAHTSNNVLEVFETADNEVAIQSYNF